MKKNLTWFAHRGADERETSILSAAYQRSIVVLWLGLIVLWGIAKFDLGQTWLGTYSFETIFTLLMLISIMSGWWTLRHEELEYASVTIKKSPSIITLGAIVAFLFGIAAAVIYTNPLYTWVAIVGFIFAELAVGAIGTWHWTKPYTTHSRVLASLIFPFQVLGFLAPHKAKTGKRIWCAGLASLYFIITPFTAAITLFNTTHLVNVVTWNGVLVPGVIDYHDQNRLPADSHTIILNYRDVDVAVGDVVLYNNSQEQQRWKSTNPIPSVPLATSIRTGISFPYTTTNIRIKPSKSTAQYSRLMVIRSWSMSQTVKRRLTVVKHQTKPASAKIRTKKPSKLLT